MSIYRNMLIQRHVDGDDGGGSRIERVLWIDAHAGVAAAIDVSAATAWPVFYACADIEAALATGDAHVLRIDPYDFIIPTGAHVTVRARQYRDAALAALEPLIADSDGAIFVPCTRGMLIREAQARATALSASRSRTSLEKDLRRWWQRGMMPDALLPDHHRGGAAGKTRVSGVAKRGPRSTYGPTPGAHSGVNVDERTRDLMMKGLQRYYEVAGDGGRRPSFRAACQRTREEFFNVGHELKDGIWTSVLPPAHHLPTDRQFRYWYRTLRDPEDAFKGREGERAFNLRGRALVGDGPAQELWPGAQWQLDATPADCHIVSDLDPLAVIGRPIIYTMKDPFGRFIAGLSVGLGAPSWAEAMVCVENAAADKVAFCRAYGVTIAERDWPCHHLPDEILADGGEFKGYNSDNLVDALGVRIGNTGAYRADQKGVVERDFRMVNDELIRDLPGAIPPSTVRGDRDSSVSACLTVRDFTALLIRRVVAYNTGHRLSDDYPLDRAMIADRVRPYPTDIWRWGLVNLGSPREVTSDRVRLNLLPRDTATVREDGIHYRHLTFDSPYGRERKWFVRARTHGAWRVDIAVEPRLVDAIYLRLDKGRQAARCPLRERYRTFVGCAWAEVDAHFARLRQDRALARTDEQQVAADLHAATTETTRRARERQRVAADAGAGAARPVPKRAVRKVRREQRARLDRERAWRLGGQPAAHPTEPLPFPRAAHAATPSYIHVHPLTDAEHYLHLRDAVLQGPTEEEGATDDN